MIKVTVSHLLDDVGALNSLAAKMDGYYERNHLRFGEWLVRNNKIDEKLKKKLKGLEKYFHGGGSPTLAFLDANAAENPGNAISKLRECAIEKKRNDVINVLKGISDDKLLKELEDNVKTEIADLLDRHVVGVDNWEMFACHFGFKHAKRKVFEEAQTAPQKFSPTRALIGILGEENSTLSIQCIIDWAKSEGRNDISGLLERFEEATRQQKSTTNKQQTTESSLNDLDDTPPALVLIRSNDSTTTSRTPQEAAVAAAAAEQVENNLPYPYLTDTPPIATSQDNIHQLGKASQASESEECLSQALPDVLVTPPVSTDDGLGCLSSTEQEQDRLQKRFALLQKK